MSNQKYQKLIKGCILFKDRYKKLGIITKFLIGVYDKLDF